LCNTLKDECNHLCQLIIYPANETKMKIIVLLIVAFTGFYITSCAQDINHYNDFLLRDNLSFGLKIGANYSTVYDTQGENFRTTPKFGLATGAFIAYPLGRKIGIQPELLFSQKGFQSTGTIQGNTYNLIRTISYINIPLLFSFKPGEYFTIMAGPQYSYLLYRKNIFANGTTSAEQMQEFENDNIRRNTLCFTGGTDITLSHIVFGARAGWDFINNTGAGISTTLRYKNMWYQATAGYRF